MKLSHLSLAVLSAIALAACGGSSSDNHVEDPKPKPPVTPEQPPKQDNEVEEPEKIVDPTETGVVGKLDFNTESSVGTTHYIRDEKSDFDRVNNPSEKTVATSILGVNLNSQNPHLTNIALAKYVNEDGLIKAVQFLGNDGIAAAEIDNPLSLQSMNRFNVFIPGSDASKLNAQLNGLKSDLTITTGTGDVVASNTEVATIDAKIKTVDKALKLLAKQNTLTAEQELWRDQLSQLSVKLKAAKPEAKLDRYVSKFYLAGTGKNFSWGDQVPTSDAAIADPYTPLAYATPPTFHGALAWSDEEKRAVFTPDSANDHTGPLALGLVGMGFLGQGLTPDKKVDIQGTEEQSRSSTRIFGRNFNDQGLKAPYNSYKGATHIVLKDDITALDIADSNVDTLDNLKTYMDDGTSVYDFDFGLAVTPMQLKYVQYGRVTGNLNPPEMSDEELADSKTYYKRVPYLNHGDAAAVDTYFYRGPNATTLEQMAALPSGKQLVYTGHALMYGIDNNFHGEVSSAVPNAFGAKGSYGVGNFVTATFDVDAQRVEKGLVYNVWHDPTSHIQVEDAVVSFDGNVFGNTVLGEAQRTYNKSDKADFRASFFGDKAEEMGGSFNSTTWQERYGAQGDIWGGVFGAQRTADKAAQLSNQQLGDIESLTPPAKQPKK